MEFAHYDASAGDLKIANQLGEVNGGLNQHAVAAIDERRGERILGGRQRALLRIERLDVTVWAFGRRRLRRGRGKAVERQPAHAIALTCERLIPAEGIAPGFCELAAKLRRDAILREDRDRLPQTSRYIRSNCRWHLARVNGRTKAALLEQPRGGKANHSAADHRALAHLARALCLLHRKTGRAPGKRDARAPVTI